MEAIILNIVTSINSYLWNYILVFILIGLGLFFTIKTKFVQIRCFGEGCRNVFGKMLDKSKNKNGISSFQAFATAVAAQVGTGNIVGASGAILVGGPGAIFWMWVIAFFGMATIYAEAILAQKTRVVNEDGTVSGGPVYYIKKAFNNKFGKFLAGFFAVAAILALGFMGAMVQSNSIGEACANAFGIPAWSVGLVLVAVSALIFVFGVKGIAKFSEKIVPIMAVLYLVGGLIIIGFRIQYIPETFGMIFKYAFEPEAILGGGIGAAILQGAKRGLFSNEAGMGSTPHAHALAEVKDPHTQGTTAMISVFLDTFVVVTMTAIIVISTLYVGKGVDPALSGAIVKTNAVQEAFKTIFTGDIGAKISGIFVAICLTFFAFSTIISWNLFGKINMEYLFGKKSSIIYSIIAIGFIFLGSCLSNDLVWELTDTFNGLMVLPNAIALIALSGLVVCVKRSKGKRSVDSLQNEGNDTDK
ncbi:MAG: sodium:alanine symporter family protein [Clostridia bacterium]|nr:sodium:alanine symporter family protein [Clostridia bacterium]